jgi:hypothetical protein
MARQSPRLVEEGRGLECTHSDRPNAKISCGHAPLSMPVEFSSRPLYFDVGPSRYAADSRIKHSISPRATGCKAKDA